MGIKPSLAALAALVIATAAFFATRPSSYRVQRSVTVAAPPAVVAAQIVDLQRWIAWSPWERDPGAQRRFGGPSAGVGSSAYWSGQGETGRARLTVTGARADRVEVEREVEGPRAHSCDLEFTLAPEGAGTRVTWVVTGASELPGRLLGLLPAPVRGIGRDLERGLAQLKAVAEAQAASAPRRVERSASVAAAPAVVLAQIADLHRWNAWSRWERLAPGAKVRYGGPASGAGASCYWSGSDGASRGRLTIIRATTEKVELELEGPRPSTSDMELRLVADGAGTRVGWVMTGEDAANGEDLARNLSRLKAVAEAEARALRRRVPDGYPGSARDSVARRVGGVSPRTVE